MADTLARQRQIVGTAADWAENDLVLGAGELALVRESDGKVRARVGNGSLRFSAAPYLNDPQGPLVYVGETDPTAPPPAGASPGDMYSASPGGTVDSSWGEPAAGEVVAEGDFLVMASDGTWHVVGSAIDLAGLVQVADLAAPDGAAMVGYQQDAPSATPRDMLGKARERWSGADFLPAGYLSDGSVDYSGALNAAIAETPGTILRLPRGTFKATLTQASRNVQVEGEGITATKLAPGAGVAVTANYRDAAWEYARIGDLAFANPSGFTGIGFRAGGDTYTAFDEYTGRFIFERVGFRNLDIGASFPTGNIGKHFIDCTGEACNYHIYNLANAAAEAGDEMHAGCLTVDRGHWQGSQLASVYVDGEGTQGAGQFTFQNTIREANQGWCYFIKNLQGSAGVPGISILSEWNEANHLAASVTVGGVTGPPGWGYFFRCPSVFIHDTPISKITIGESHVTTRHCELTNLVPTYSDGFCSLFHEQARAALGAVKGLTWSVGAIQNATGLNSPSYAMPRPVGIWPYTAQTLAVLNGQTVISFTGSHARTSVEVLNDPGLPWLTKSQDLTVNAGEQIFPTTTGFVFPSGKYVVFLYVARLISGPGVDLILNGNAGFGGFRCDNPEWRTYAGFYYNVNAAVTNENIYHTSAATSVIRIGGMACVQFDTAQEARAFVNLRLFPVSASPTYDLVNLPQVRTFNPETANVRAVARVLATLIGDLQQRQLPG
jgi:hypothetical protein